MGQPIRLNLERGVLDLPNAIVMNDPRPKIRCARQGCLSVTLRDVRLADSLPAPADAGWWEVEVTGTKRTVLFCCSQRCAQQVSLAMNVVPDLSAFSEHPVLPE